MADPALDGKEVFHPHVAEIAILTEVSSLRNELFSLTDEIDGLIRTNTYRFISKRARNRLLSAAVQRADEISETLKVLHRNLKKVRREKPSDEQVDLLYIRDLQAAGVVQRAYLEQDADES